MDGRVRAVSMSCWWTSALSMKEEHHRSFRPVLLFCSAVLFCFPFHAVVVWCGGDGVMVVVVCGVMMVCGVWCRSIDLGVGQQKITQHCTSPNDLVFPQWINHHQDTTGHSTGPPPNNNKPTSCCVLLFNLSNDVLLVHTEYTYTGEGGIPS